MAVVTVYNPSSGHMDSDHWGRFCRRHGALLGELVPLRQLPALPAAALGSRDLVLAVGGDGTVHAAAVHIGVGRVPAERLPTLLVLPTGTTNSIARSLGIPLAPVCWPLYIRKHRRALLDVGVAGGRPFLLCLSAGYSGWAVTCGERLRRGGSSAVYYAAAIMAGLLRRYRLTVTAEPYARIERAAEVIVANMRRFAGVVRIAAAEPADGRLALVAMRRPLGFLAAALASASGGPQIQTVPTQSVRIEGAGVYQIDGEAGGSLPVEVTVAKGALPLGLPGATAVQAKLPA